VIAAWFPAHGDDLITKEMNNAYPAVASRNSNPDHHPIGSALASLGTGIATNVNVDRLFADQFASI
jgi:hypothetical protein